MRELEAIKELIESNKPDNFELAFLLLEGLRVSEEDFIEINYGDLLNCFNQPTRSKYHLFKMFFVYTKFEFLNTRGIFPKNIGLIKNAKSLMCNYSSIKFIPESFQELHLLEELCLRGNNLQFIPSWIANLKSLKYLDVSQNPLDKKSLKEFLLKKNKISISYSDYNN